MNKIYFTLLFLTTFSFTSCNEREEYIDPRGSDYAGSENCIKCHQDIANSHSNSPHNKATSPAIIKNILGYHSETTNYFYYNKETKISIEKRNDSLYQVVYKNNKEIEAHAFAILFGNKNAQTSVYWKNNNTYELPISYYTAIKKWGTSPGFPSDKPYFDRQVIKDCFSCHSSNVSSKIITTNSDKKNFMTSEIEDVINPQTIVFGIDCERCHGPARKHADYHLQNPNAKIAKYITEYNKLSQQQKLDACALCHSGNKGMKGKSRFEFKPGDNINDYFRSSFAINDTANIDVHGNQYQMLLQSKCFIKTEKMDCMTCHNPHEENRKNTVYYNTVCISCHTTLEHKTSEIISLSKKEIANKCIECHMPKKSSNAIRFHLSLDSNYSNYNLRSHRIAIYSNAKK